MEEFASDIILRYFLPSGIIPKGPLTMMRLLQRLLDFNNSHMENSKTPQNWLTHGWIALCGSLGMIFYGLIGIIHAIFPWIRPFQFMTSSFILRLAKQLILIARHDDEIKAIYGQDFFEKAAAWRMKEKLGKDTDTA